MAVVDPDRAARESRELVVGLPVLEDALRGNNRKTRVKLRRVRRKEWRNVLDALDTRPVGTKGKIPLATSWVKRASALLEMRLHQSHL